MVLLGNNLVKNEAIVSILLILGYFFAIIFNPLVNIFYGLRIISRKPLFAHIPKWLVLANFIFLLLQLQYILFLNDSIYN